MASSPPAALETASAAPFGRNREAYDLDGGVMFFCVEGAPRSACRTITEPPALRFVTHLAGRITEVSTDVFVIGGDDAPPVTVRHLLPAGVSLEGLLHREVTMVIEQCYSGAGRATIRAELRDAAGALLLFAWDGRMPRDAEVPGLALRVSLDSEGGSRLAVGGDHGLVTLPSPGRARIPLRGAGYEALLLRVAADDLSLLLLRAS